ncbi:lysine exporter LysO family protein [Youxingia wuxianensis]|nr:lysine exporter LysO family protein [Youxingia wuxianensis]
MIMIGIALASLALGLFSGYFVFSAETVEMMSGWSYYGLIILIFAAGIEIGTNKVVFQKMKEYHIRSILIPAGTLVGSILGGILMGWALGLPANESAAVAGSCGFYSVAPMLLRELGGPQLGTLAFLTNILRETFTYLAAPVAVKLLNKYSAIAIGGATSMDSTLPAIAKATDQETALLSVISGVVLTAAVPVLVPLIYQLGNLG